nr:hypothetical protein [Tanacetum cinerariifolium]
MQHPVDGRAWKNFDTKYPDFKKEPRNARLGLAANGFNPSGNLKSSCMLTFLILGPKSLGKDIDVYLRPLIDGLKELWALKGVETIDIATGQTFNMRAIVLWTINDFPARSSLHFIYARVRQNKNEKCLKPQAAYSFTPKNRKKFYRFIKGVKLPDGFGSNFKNKVPDNDTNIIGLKSHDFHIMMQRLLPYGLQQYLPIDIAKLIIKLCLLFKQIYSQTLMEDDMLKAQSKVVDIRLNIKLIYPPAFFDIMIHLVIHLPLDALEGGPIRFGGYGQSMDVDAPPDIINVEKDNDIIDDEDALPHDLADSNDENLINVDDDNDVAVVASGHGGNGSGDDYLPPHHTGSDYRGKGTQKPNLRGRKDGRLNIYKESRNLGLRKIMDQLGPQIGMRRLPFGLIPRTLPGVFKMLKTRKRAWSYAGRDPGHFLSSEIGRVLARRGRDILVLSDPRCTCIGDVVELKRTNKQLKKLMDMIMKISKERIPFELSSACFPQLHVVREEYPHGHVIKDSGILSPVIEDGSVVSSPAMDEHKVTFGNTKDVNVGHSSINVTVDPNLGRSRYDRAMIELQADVELKDTIVVAMPKLIMKGFYTCNIGVEYAWKPPSISTTVSIDQFDKIKKLIIDGKITLVDDEGKPLEQVAYPGDHDSEDEVEPVDNEMASFWLQISSQSKPSTFTTSISSPLKPPMEECPKNPGLGVAKNLKKSSQSSRGVLIGLKVGFKPSKEYRPVSKKSTANTSGNKKKGVKPTKEVSNSNPFDVLNSVDNDVELGTNGETSNLASNEDNSSGSSFWNVETSSTSTTPIVVKIRKLEKLIIDGKVTLVDDDGKPLKNVGCGTKSLLEQWRDTYENSDNDEDPYDDDMYKGDSCLRLSHPCLFSLENNKVCAVATKMSAPFVSSLRRDVRGGEESAQLSQIYDLLDTVVLSNMGDRQFWDLNGDGCFRVKDVHRMLDDMLLPKSDVPSRWVKQIPIKVNVLAWKISMDRLPTRDDNVRRTPISFNVDLKLGTKVGPTSTGNTPSMSSYANVTGVPCRKALNFRTLFTLFSLIDGLDEVFENSPCFIRNNLLILKKWNPDVNLLKEDVGNVLVWVKLYSVPMTRYSKDGLSAIAIKIELKDNIVVAMPKLIGEGFYTCTAHVEYEWKPSRLIIEGKVTLVDDEGKPLAKVDSSGDHDSKDEVASVDNEMAKFLASKKVGHATNSLLEQWKKNNENDDYDFDPYDDDMYEGQDIPDKIQAICDNLDIKVRGTPMMLESYINTVCLDLWGQSNYALALIEVHAKNDLKDNLMVSGLMVSLAYLYNEGYTRKTISIEYEWRPLHCEKPNMDDQFELDNSNKARISGNSQNPTHKRSNVDVSDDELELQVDETLFFMGDVIRVKAQLNNSKKASTLSSIVLHITLPRGIFRV